MQQMINLLTLLRASAGNQGAARDHGPSSWFCAASRLWSGPRQVSYRARIGGLLDSDPILRASGGDRMVQNDVFPDPTVGPVK
jgi:hypothetical protein